MSSPGHSEVPELVITEAAAQAAFDEGRFEDVVAIAVGLDRASKATRTSIRLARDAYFKLGELHLSLGEANRLRAIAASPKLDASTRRLLGRIIETDPTWLPKITLADPPDVGVRHSDRRIFHLLKESTPYAETGFTLRSRMTLQAQRIAGYSPVVATSLGFPENKGVTDAPAHQLVEGVPHYHYSRPQLKVGQIPFDQVLTMSVNWAAGIADTVEPNLVQAGTGYRGFETALLGIAIADRRQIPIVYEVRGFQEATWTGNAARGEKGEYYRRRRLQEDRCMARADLVITIGEAMAREIVERGVPEGKVGVVPNAVDVDRFAPRRKSAELLERYGLADRFVLGYISNLGAREGIHNLIRAVGILRSRGHDVACLIAGDGPERSRLDDLVVELGLNGHVVLTGHVPNDQIEDHYALIDLFVVPRIDDRAARMVTPLKPLEAMAMRLPVISSSLPALRELIAPGERGLNFAPDDAEELAGVAAQLIADGALREQFASAGYEWVREHRTVASNAVRYANLLGPLLPPA